MKALLRNGQIYWGKANTPFHNSRQISKPEEGTGSRALCKKVKPISELQQQLKQLQSAGQCKEGHLPPKLQLETKVTLISF